MPSAVHAGAGGYIAFTHHLITDSEVGCCTKSAFSNSNIKKKTNKEIVYIWGSKH